MDSSSFASNKKLLILRWSRQAVPTGRTHSLILENSSQIGLQRKMHVRKQLFIS